MRSSYDRKRDFAGFRQPFVESSIQTMDSRCGEGTIRTVRCGFPHRTTRCSGSPDSRFPEGTARVTPNHSKTREAGNPSENLHGGSWLGLKTLSFIRRSLTGSQSDAIFRKFQNFSCIRYFSLRSSGRRGRDCETHSIRNRDCHDGRSPPERSTHFDLSKKSDFLSIFRHLRRLEDLC